MFYLALPTHTCYSTAFIGKSTTFIGQINFMLERGGTLTQTSLCLQMYPMFHSKIQVINIQVAMGYLLNLKKYIYLGTLYPFI